MPARHACCLFYARFSLPFILFVLPPYDFPSAAGSERCLADRDAAARHVASHFLLDGMAEAAVPSCLFSSSFLPGGPQARPDSMRLSFFLPAVKIYAVRAFMRAQRGGSC